jgi:hypothetical protein
LYHIVIKDNPRITMVSLMIFQLYDGARMIDGQKETVL